MIDKFLLYEDDKTKVEIDYDFHNFLKSTQPIFIELDEEEFHFVLLYAIEILKSHNLYSKEDGSKLIGNIPVIKSGVGLCLQPPYTGFNDILHYLCLFPNLDDRREAIEEDINDCFKEEGYHCYIFPHKIFDIKGVLLHKTEENSIMMLFGFRENNPNLEFLDFL